MDKKMENYVITEAILGKELLKRNIRSLFLELEENNINITNFDSYKKLSKMLDEMDEYNNNLLKDYKS